MEQLPDVNSLFSYLRFSDFLGYLFQLIPFVLSTLGMWKVFEKSGEEAWFALIPLYNTQVIAKLSNFSRWKAFLYSISSILLLPLFGVLFMYFAYPVIKKELLIAIAVLLFVFFLVFQYWGIMMHIRLAKAFGQDKIYGIGLYFLGFVFFPLLGFSNYEYNPFNVDDNENWIIS